MSDKKYLTAFFLHASIWLLFMSIPIIISPNPKELGFHFTRADHLSMAFSFSLYAILFYSNYYLLIPRLWMRYGWPQYLIGIAICISIIASIQYGIRYEMIHNQVGYSHHRIFFEKVGFFMLVSSNIVFWVVSSGLWLLKKWKKSEEQLKESEYKRTEAELSQLKKQLNPHFLFNTLNGIYALALTQDTKAPDAILKLSKLLSYVLKKGHSDYINMQEDIDHLQHFIELNKMRLSDRNQVSCHFEGAFKSYQIAPLIILPFVENAFKYGVSNIKPSLITIRIEIKEHRLYFNCRNTIVDLQKEASTVHSSGVGIANTIRRLELLYPEQHKILIGPDKGEFSVALEIVLQNAPASPLKQDNKAPLMINLE